MMIYKGAIIFYGIGRAMKKLGGHIIFFMKNRGVTKIIKSWWGGVTKLLNIPVTAVAVFQNFPHYTRRSNNFITFSYYQTKVIHNFSNHTQIEYQTSSLNCTLVSYRLEMVRSPQFNLFLFSKMTRRCNLKTCSYFGEVDNMQMICERTQWKHFEMRQIFFKTTGNA